MVNQLPVASTQLPANPFLGERVLGTGCWLLATDN
jgi:hypothetical protein